MASQRSRGQPLITPRLCRSRYQISMVARRSITLNGENADIFLHDHEHTASRALQRLNRSKIKNRIVGTMASEEALKNLGPMPWSEDVLS